MFNLRALSQEDTEKLLDMETVIEKVEQAYVMKHSKSAVLWPMIFHEFEPGAKDMDIKSGYMKDSEIFGLKLVSWFGPNSEKNLPQLIGTVMVFDAETGVPKAILSGEHITKMRTGAAGAIGAKYLARKDSKNLLMTGTGHQAEYQIAATLIAVPSIKKVSLWNPLNQEHALTFKENMEKKLDTRAVFEVVSDIESAAGSADIIITATPSREALIKKEWIKPGTHFSCIGSDMSGKQEIDEKLFAEARVFTDDINQSISVGEAEKAVKSGVISQADISEIGAVISGEITGRQAETDLTIFDSTGIALQDLITANYAVDKAEKTGAGTRFSL